MWSDGWMGNEHWDMHILESERLYTTPCRTAWTLVFASVTLVGINKPTVVLSVEPSMMTMTRVPSHCHRVCRTSRSVGGLFLISERLRIVEAQRVRIISQRPSMTCLTRIPGAKVPFRLHCLIHKLQVGSIRFGLTCLHVLRCACVRWACS